MEATTKVFDVFVFIWVFRGKSVKRVAWRSISAAEYAKIIHEWGFRCFEVVVGL